MVMRLRTWAFSVGSIRWTSGLSDEAAPCGVRQLTTAVLRDMLNIAAR